MAPTLTAERAAELVRAGGTVRMVVGPGAEDPTLLVWLDGSSVMCESIAGWSQGVVEQVCAANSDFLDHYFRGRERLDVVP